MGKMPLASLISACSIGMLLTGCNCCKHGTKPFAEGKDQSMHLFSRSTPNNSASALDSVPLNSVNSPSPVGAAPLGAPLSTAAGSGNPNLSMNSGGMGMSTNPGGMPAMGGMPVPPSNPPTSPAMSMNSGSLGSQLSPMAPDLSPSVTAGGAGSGLPSSAVQQASHQVDGLSSLQKAAYHPSERELAPALPTKSPSRAMTIPPPPPIPMAPLTPSPSAMKSNAAKVKTSGDSEAWMNSKAASSVPPPSPQPNDSTDMLSSPPSGSPSKVPGLDAKPTTSSSRRTFSPEYITR